MSLLEIDHVSKRFGGLLAVDDVSLRVEPGSISALIGPNGAGKTTLFNCVTGLLEPDGGDVRLEGRDLTKMDVYRRARAGLGRTFQRLEVFTGMTVAENLQVAVEVAHPGSVFIGMFRWRHTPDPRTIERVDRVLEDIGLADVRDVPAGDLPTGTLRRVEFGRALCTEPKVLLLDEPASGLDSGETELLRDVLRRIAGDGVGILLVEHDVELVMEVSDHVYVMDFGRLMAEGSPAEVRDDPAVRAAYLGEESSATDEPGVPA